MIVRTLRLVSMLLAALVVTANLASADEPKTARAVLESRGYLMAASQITVGPKVAGQVVELSVEEGQYVKAGEVLARLDSEESKAALLLARAKLKLAEAELAKVKEALTKADIAIAEAKVEVARAEVALAQTQLDATTVRAPINGIVLAKRAEVGTRIDPKAAQGAASLCDLADLRNMEVEVWIVERDLAKIVKGQACIVQVEALPNATFQGRVARLQPSADRARGAVAIRVRLEPLAASEWLRPELSAIVQFLTKE